MADYAVPRHIRVVDVIPRNRTGKIDKRALRETMELELHPATATPAGAR
jgi:acyl-coenzyme A synthetase/AMP-(fatty) acid ligase